MLDFAGALKELKAYGLLGRVSALEVKDTGVRVELGPAGGEKRNEAKEALERAQLEEETMYASAGN